MLVGVVLSWGFLLDVGVVEGRVLDGLIGQGAVLLVLQFAQIVGLHFNLLFETHFVGSQVFIVKIRIIKWIWRFVSHLELSLSCYLIRK